MTKPLSIERNEFSVQNGTMTIEQAMAIKSLDETYRSAATVLSLSGVDGLNLAKPTAEQVTEAWITLQQAATE